MSSGESLNGGSVKVEEDDGPKTPQRTAKAAGKRGTSGEESGSPQKKPRTPSKPKVPKEPKSPKSPRIGKGANDRIKIPKSWDEAGRADRLLVQMKESGKGRAEIDAMWLRETGQEAGGSTLTGRYNRIKVNLAHLEDGDDVKLLSALANWEVEKTDFENKKFTRLAEIMTTVIGTKRYAPDLLRKELRRIQDEQAQGTLVASSAANVVANGDDDAADGADKTEEEGTGEDEDEGGDAN